MARKYMELMGKLSVSSYLHGKPVHVRAQFTTTV